MITGPGQVAGESCLASVRTVRERDSAETGRLVEIDSEDVPVVISRSVRLEEVVVVTVFDASFAREKDVVKEAS